MKDKWRQHFCICLKYAFEVFSKFFIVLFFLQFYLFGRKKKAILICGYFNKWFAWEIVKTHNSSFWKVQAI
jgi:hypothetical protein